MSGDVTVNVDFSGSSGTADFAARSDHTHDAVYQGKYANVKVVAQSGGDFTDPATAMSVVATWCTGGSGSCLLKIMPGTYNIGTSTITMSPFVDIEGAGRFRTVIEGSGTVIVEGASNAEIRGLSIKPVGTSDIVAISNANSPIPGMYMSIKDVNVYLNGTNGSGTHCFASNNDTKTSMIGVEMFGEGNQHICLDLGSDAEFAINNSKLDNFEQAIKNNSSKTLILSNVTITNALEGVICNSPIGSTLIKDSEIQIAGGSGWAVQGFGKVEITNSRITGTIRGESTGDIKIANSLVGTVINNGGLRKCVGAYNTNYIELATNCQ